MTAPTAPPSARAARPAISARRHASATLAGLLALGAIQIIFQESAPPSFGLLYRFAAEGIRSIKQIVFQDSAQNTDAHARERVPAINTALRAASGPFILLAGDSHSALAAGSPLCGYSTVNGGIGGTGTAVYRTLSRELAPRMRPIAVILTIGTNDMLARTKPSAPTAMARLVSNAEATIADLAAITDRLVVTAVPPVSARVAAKFNGDAMVRFSGELRRLCTTRPNCTFADPFASIRSQGIFNVARPSTLSDDLHLADYPAAYQALKPLICPASNAPPAESR